MRNCNYLGYNEAIVFSQIVSEKYEPGKTTLDLITDRVHRTYRAYIGNFNLLKIKPSSEFNANEVAQKEALQLCYSSPTKSFNYIIGRIFEIQPDVLKDFCPYCLLNKPTTLDHYIGQTEFPEYSILLRNLIPCCYNCNQSKGKIWRKNGARRIIHYYNDRFLHKQFLNAILIYPRGEDIPKIHFYISRPLNMTGDEWDIVRFHFKDLHLLLEYNSRANTLVSSEIDIIRDSIVNGVSKEDIKRTLLSRARSLARTYGVNYWCAILYETIANNRKLLKLL